MARQTKTPTKREIDAYMHDDKDRVNNPPVGLVTPDTDKDLGKKTYSYDPHLDPTLQWAGKAEHTSFEVPTVSLHVHERIDPKTIVQQVKKKNGGGQPDLFHWADEERPIREAIEFYKHKNNWTNRLIAGDSLLVMNSLLEKEGMAGQVQMVFIDPPYGISYGSNFQPFTNKRNVKDRSDTDLTAEPETLKAFRDTWELGIHSYLTYMRDRLLLARELLNDTGSCFVQISDENLHHTRELLDEVFGTENFVSIITFRTKIPLGTTHLPGIADYLVWYAKDKSKLKFNRLFTAREIGSGTQYTWLELPDGTRRKMTDEEKNNPAKLPIGARAFRLSDLVSSGRTESCVFEFELNGRKFSPSGGKSWKTNKEGIQKLISVNKIVASKTSPSVVAFVDEYPVQEITNMWMDTQGASDKTYAVQTSTKVIQRCILMASDPGDLILDPTCGSGTIAYVSEQWGRRWVTCDTSRVAIALAKQRLMTSFFDFFELARANEGIGSGLKYKTVPHITLGSITNNEPPPQETLYDQPIINKSKVRVTGPFTVEAVPAPVVKPIDDIDVEPAADASVARTGETARQYNWQEELLKTGIRGKAGQRIEFSRVETLPGCYYLHADAETKADNPERVVIAFGPDHAPLEQRQVELAIEEAGKLVPKPKIVVFAAFQFDPEAAKDIDETNWPGVTLLKAQMNADLLTDDLKKKRSSNESFWLIGQPDVVGKRDKDGKWQIEVQGFDYFNTKTGTIDSGGSDRIAMWMLDTDYDGRSLFPRQVFFPMAGESEGWAKLAKNLKAEIDEDLIEAYRGTISLPFEVGEHKRAAVKIIDDRGIESLKIINLQS
jgi:adenine-specific DNA-methyltransferase